MGDAVVSILWTLVDSIVKVLRLPPAVEGTVRLGYPENVVLGIGIIEPVLIWVALFLRDDCLRTLLPVRR
jgi:hypothetical protein